MFEVATSGRIRAIVSHGNGFSQMGCSPTLSPSPRTRQPPYNAQDEGDNEVVVLFDAIDCIVQAGNKVTEKSVKWVESHV